MKDKSRIREGEKWVFDDEKWDRKGKQVILMALKRSLKEIK